MAMDQYIPIESYRYNLLGDEHPFTSDFDVHQGYRVFDPSPYQFDPWPHAISQDVSRCDSRSMPMWVVGFQLDFQAVVHKP